MLSLLLSTLALAAVAPAAQSSTTNGVPCQGDGDSLGGSGVRTGYVGAWEVDDYNIHMGGGRFIVIPAEYVNNVFLPSAIHFASWINEENCTMRCEGGNVVLCQAIETGWHTIGVHSHGPSGDYVLLTWSVA